MIVAAGGEPSPQAAMAATQTIPIVFTASVDPVSSGLVASLNRPGGNVTGVTIFGSEAIAKRVEMLRELVPKAASIAYLMNPMHPNAESEWRDAQTAAHFLGQQILVIRASSERDFEAAFATISQRGAQSLLITSTRLTSACAPTSSCWRHVCGYPPCTSCASLLRLAV